MKYHSALHKPSSYPAIEHVQLGESVAFFHDLAFKVPYQYNKCDIIYTETPWIDGFDVFETRANVGKKRTYEEFMASLCEFINALNKPTILVTGKKGLKFLPKPDIEAVTILNGAQARAVMYGVNVTKVSNSLTILSELANKYKCVGDPCCGFGRSAKAFKQAGKNFVVSDYNKECIGYIAEEWGNW
jgi:hypothetical protein